MGHASQGQPYILCRSCRFENFTGKGPRFTCRQRNAGSARECHKYEREPGAEG